MSVTPAVDPLLALLAGCEANAASLHSSALMLVSLTADLVARCHESAQRAHSVLLACKTRVLGCGKRFSRKQCKEIVAIFEASDVTVEQLCVWAAVAGTAYPSLDDALHCTYTASPLLASPLHAQVPVIGITSSAALQLVGELGRVATGDGLRVVSAAGPGLLWYGLHPRNSFSVVLAQAGGVVPVWLTTGDVAVIVHSTTDKSLAVGVARTSASTRTTTIWGSVDVMYGIYGSDYDGGLHDGPGEAVLQLTVCGVVVADANGGGDWRTRVRRRPLAVNSSECGAFGTHIRALRVVEGGKRGMAVSPDEQWLVVGTYAKGTLFVYLLPWGRLVRTFGGKGDGPLQFNGLRRLCFAANGNLIVVDGGNRRLHEVTLEGKFVRFIGVGTFGGAWPNCVAVHDDLIAVGVCNGGGPRLVLFNFHSGAVISRFGEIGAAPGQLSAWCSGIQLTIEGSIVIAVEDEAKCISLFTTTGEFVARVGMGVLGGGMMDALLSVTGEFVVADFNYDRVCVVSREGRELVRSWGGRDGRFKHPTALATAGQHLYVLDGTAMVQVFD